MRNGRYKADFDQTGIDQVRAQAALIPAVTPGAFPDFLTAKAHKAKKDKGQRKNHGDARRKRKMCNKDSVVIILRQITQRCQSL
jgi:hypothetical protein